MEQIQNSQAKQIYQIFLSQELNYLAITPNKEVIKRFKDRHILSSCAVASSSLDDVNTYELLVNMNVEKAILKTKNITFTKFTGDEETFKIAELN